MSLEEEKISAIRKYLLDALPGHEVQDGSRTHVDRTLQTALLDGSRPSVLELEEALEKHNVAPWVLSSPVVYLHHNTLGLIDK